MINRRHIRTKVMQSVYAMLLSENDNVDKQEKYLMESIDKMYHLYVLQYQLFTELHTKAETLLKTAEQKYIRSGHFTENMKNFVENKVLIQIKNSSDLLNFKFKKDDTQWKNHDEIINLIWKDIIVSERFQMYLTIENPDYEADKKFLLKVFKKDIAPNKHLFEFG